MSDTTYDKVGVRLCLAEQAMVSELQARLATPLMPTVTRSDVLRAGLRALLDTLNAQGVA